ncbi:MAG: M20 family metallopeptidase [Caldisphaera sp.]|nr:MAG: succinyl-diaminopimelate desuccinylase [Caldisphaera sp.]
MNIDDAIDDIKKDLIDFLIRIINIPTENPPGKNYEKFVQFLGDYLSSLGYNVDIISPTKEELKELVRFGEGERPNIVASYGNGNIKIGFNGHYDVVPAGRGWVHDPYNATIENGRIYGRGSSDMKGGIASQIFSLEVLKRIRDDNEIRGKIMIRQFIVADEETVGNKNAGTYYLVKKGYISNENLDYLIFTEPLDPTNVCIGHRGALWGFFKLYGKKSHGGFPVKGGDTIRCAAKIINYIYELSDKKSNVTSNYNIIPETSKHPSFLVGTINGGDWMNTVSDYLIFSYVRRLIPEEKLENSFNEIQEIINLSNKICPEIKTEFETYYSTDSVIMENSLDNKFLELIEKVYNKKPAIVLSPGTFDIRFVSNLKIKSFNYGPGLLEKAHASDEYINIEDLLNTTKVLSLYLNSFLK